MTNELVKTTYSTIPMIDQIDILGVGLSANTVKVDGKNVEFQKSANKISIPVNLKPITNFKVEWSF